MMDIATDKAISIVDLDTVKPGLVQYDIGDCLRWLRIPWAKKTEQWEAIRFDRTLSGHPAGLSLGGKGVSDGG